MRIPNEVKIGAHIFTIEKRKMDDLHGECENRELRITIDDTYPKSQQEETFFHEVLHAIRKLQSQEIKDDEDEEKVVQPLAHAFYAFLKDNNLLK